jgi:hypothetical protein
MSPCPVMKMIGSCLLALASSRCSSSPLWPGSRTSSTRQVGPSGRSAARNSLTEPGIPLLKEALEELHTQRHDSLKVEFLCDLAAGLIAMGKHREALTLIVDAIDVQQRGGKLLYMPALFRMKGLILASRSAEDHFEAEESLLSAIDWAKHQHASLFELKAATDLAELLQIQGVCQKPANTSVRRLIECRPKLHPPTYKRALQILDDLQPGIRAVG